MKKIIALAVLATVMLSGCAVHKEMVPTGGSRADGTVKMSYNYGIFQKPVIDYQQAANTAAARCGAWGYSGAEAFGGTTSQCSYMSADGCMAYTVTMEYQCTGGAK